MECEIRKINLRQNKDQRKQEQLEDEKEPAPPLHEYPTVINDHMPDARFVSSRLR